MNGSDIFNEALTEILGDGISIGESEPVDNTWSVSLSGEQVASTSPERVAAFLEQARAAYASIATDHQRVLPLRFYAWFDEMAGQLRFSVSSRDPLPFGGPIDVAQDAQHIADQFLTSDYLRGISLSELHDVDMDDASNRPDEPEPAFPPLDVYVTNLFID